MPASQLKETMVKHRTTKLLGITSTLAVVGGLMLPGTAGASTPSPTAGLEQAVVALSGSSAVTVPGVHLQALLPAVHSEVVSADPAALAALAHAPGVLGISPNLSAHLDSLGYSGNHGNGNHGSGNHGNGNGNGSDSGTGGDTGGTDDGSAAPTAGVIAPTTLGGAAGTAEAGRGATIALIDTGVSDTEALNRASGRLVDAVDTSGLNSEGGAIREDGTFTDGYGHGTFMASVIAGGTVVGSGDGGLGVAPGATVEVVKVADDAGTTSLAAVLAGLNWVATHADSVDVANLSLSVDRPTNRYGIDPLNYAVSLTRDAGVTVVVAAGNTPGEVGDPGFAPDALTVGAADTTGDTPSVASFSGYADVDGVTKPDVVAAGVDVLGEMPADSAIGRQYPQARQPSGLFRGSGTSQSTALVSGLAALYIASHHDASPLLVKSAIRDAATSISADPSDGQGLVSLPGDGDQRYNTGEQDLNVGQWVSAGAAWGVFDIGWLSRTWLSRSWLARSWLSRSWMDGTWDSRSWLARTWLSRSWTARTWLSRSWMAGTWDARSWLSRSWMSRTWTSRSWTSRTWTSRSWVARSWVSDNWSARSWMAADWSSS